MVGKGWSNQTTKKTWFRSAAAMSGVCTHATVFNLVRTQGFRQDLLRPAVCMCTCILTASFGNNIYVF